MRDIRVSNMVCSFKDHTPEPQAPEDPWPVHEFDQRTLNIFAKADYLMDVLELPDWEGDYTPLQKWLNRINYDLFIRDLYKNDTDYMGYVGKDVICCFSGPFNPWFKCLNIIDAVTWEGFPGPPTSSEGRPPIAPGVYNAVLDFSNTNSVSAEDAIKSVDSMLGFHLNDPKSNIKCRIYIEDYTVFANYGDGDRYSKIDNFYYACCKFVTGNEAPEAMFDSNSPSPNYLDMSSIIAGTKYTDAEDFDQLPHYFLIPDTLSNKWASQSFCNKVDYPVYDFRGNGLRGVGRRLNSYCNVTAKNNDGNENTVIHKQVMIPSEEHKGYFHEVCFGGTAVDKNTFVYNECKLGCVILGGGGVLNSMAGFNRAYNPYLKRLGLEIDWYA